MVCTIKNCPCCPGGPHTHATPQEIQAARDEYANDECEIDDGALVSHADDGYWVQSWVWVPTESEEN